MNEKKAFYVIGSKHFMINAKSMKERTFLPLFRKRKNFEKIIPDARFELGLPWRLF